MKGTSWWRWLGNRGPDGAFPPAWQMVLLGLCVLVFILWASWKSAVANLAYQKRYCLGAYECKAPCPPCPSLVDE